MKEKYPNTVFSSVQIHVWTMWVNTSWPRKALQKPEALTSPQKNNCSLHPSQCPGCRGQGAEPSASAACSHSGALALPWLRKRPKQAISNNTTRPPHAEHHLTLMVTNGARHAAQHTTACVNSLCGDWRLSGLSSPKNMCSSSQQQMDCLRAQ